MRKFQGIRLRNLRLQHGYSLEMTARLLALRAERRVSRSAISHWELGRALPSMASLLALGETFHMPLDYFFDPIPNYLFGNGIHANLFLDPKLLAKPLADAEDPEPNPPADLSAGASAKTETPPFVKTVGERVPPPRAQTGV